ncbi:MAG: carboxypeptidase regulatory-like domain-containing protein [Terracidiphilus sp.]
MKSEGEVYLRLQCFIHFAIALMLALAAVIAANAQAAAPATLHGHVTDQTSALIPGAQVTITTSAGTAVTNIKADASGIYEVRGLAPGGYIVQVESQGFAPFQSQTVTLEAGQVKRVDVAMAIQVAQQNVEVTDESPTVNTEAGGNANSIVIKGKDLDALSDDPDELSNELTALAGPSAGPNGGQIYIDGFTGGQLPPKSAIREIRINQNPFSAEFDRLGYGRIEILTKPGTDKLHGRFFIQGNDDAFNTGNPFTRVIPSYHSIQFNGTLNGSLSKTASFFISAEQRNNQNASIYSLAQAPIFDASTDLYSAGPVSGALFNPHTRTNISPRIDLQLGQKNTVTLRYQFYRDAESGDINSTELPSQSSDSTSTEHALQVSDSMIINDHLVNETRFEYRRALSDSTPVSTAPLVTVPQAFTGGGSSSGKSTDHQDHLELQNVTTMSAGAHAIKFGTWMRDNRDANSTDANFNGSFNFASVADYISALNGTGGLPTKLSYTTGARGATANVFDAALFFQDDWKFSRDLTLSGGLRWESQNHISDHSDWAPRVAFAYALDGHKDKKQAKTVLRGGYGIFYDRLGVGNMLSATRFSGAADSQKQVSVTSPTCFNPTSLDTAIGNCATGTSTTSTVVQIAPSYHSPYTQQFGASLDRQLTKTTTLTFTYLHSFGLHQLVTRDSNAYLPGTFVYGSSTLTGVRPDPSLGIVNQYYPEAVFKQNQLIVNMRAVFSPKLSVFGFYNLTSANTNGAGGTASNSYNLNQDYGRASFAARNMVFMMGNYDGPWGLRFNPFLIATAGHPFDIVTPFDLTGDNFFNNRPSFATSASDPSNVVHTSYGDFDTVPQPGEQIVPSNLGNGPASVALNLRVSRAFGIGPKVEAGNAGGPPPGGPDGGHRGGGGPGGGFGPGGFGGGGGPRGMFGGAGADRKYSLTFTAQALNLFNNINYGTPVGNVTAQNFGESTSLAGRIFSSGSASRRIFIQAVFSF